MKKAPKYLQAHGALGHQLSLLPELELSLIQVPKGTRKALALGMLTTQPLNQIIWLKLKQGWRLAVTINNLRKMGWTIKTETKYLPNGIPYGEYSLLNKKQRQQAKCLLNLDTKESP